MEAIVVGGGITGAFASYFLAQLGVGVTLVERREIAGGASGANAGGLNPLHGPGIPGPLAELALDSLAVHRSTWEDLRRRSSRDFAAQHVPRLIVANGPDELAALEAAGRRYNAAAGYEARMLSPAELRRAEPRLAPDATGALWTSGNVRVDPRAYTLAVTEAAVARGARLLRDEVRGLDHADGVVRAVQLKEKVLRCDSVVIATGPWCDGPSDWLRIRLPISPVKGELLLAELPDGAPRTEITCGQAGLYTATGGRVWLGGTEQRLGYDERPSDMGRERIVNGIRRLLPGMPAPRVVGHVAALRPVTPDGIPIVGKPPGWQNVCLALGGGRKGMLFSAALGLAAAELLTQGFTRLPTESCAVGREEAAV